VKQADPERSSVQRVPEAVAGAPDEGAGRRGRRLLPEFARFGTVGAVAYVAETGTFNLCRLLGLMPVASSLAAAAAGTAVAYVGHRYWTYRWRAFGRDARRIALFCLVNVLGAGITTGALVVSHLLFRHTGIAADNVSRNLVGMALAMVFRFWAYRTWVFPEGEGGPVRPARRPGREGRAAGAAGADGWQAAVTAAVPPWLLAHALVAAALVVVVWWRGELPDTGAVRPSSGLLVWDSGWYRALAVHGYGPLGPKSVRFFPLLPLMVRAGVAVGHLPPTGVLIALCSACALAYGAVLYTLVHEETGDRRAARMTVWLSQLVPGSMVLALGYTEAPAGLLAVVFFLLLRRGRGIAAVPAGVLSGLVRPTGLLLALPALVEFVRARSHGRRLQAVPAALSAPAGTLLYLLWCALAGHGLLAPYTVQTRPGLRGGLISDPFDRWLDAASGRLNDYALFGLTVATLMLAAAVRLLWVGYRRLPLAYTAWAVPMVALAATATAFRSTPRYLAEVFPLLAAAALVLPTRPRRCAVLVVCGGVYVAMAVFVFAGHIVP
jgi:putative flippase GtrA